MSRRVAASPEAAPERVDLRVGLCFPYLPVASQGSDQSCVAHSFSAALYCLKAQAALSNFPVSHQSEPALARIFASALEASPDRHRGTSIESVVEGVLREHGQDLAALGWRVVALDNSVELCKQRLRLGAPVVAGYQVNARIAAFHATPEVCEAHGFLLPAFSADPQAESAHAVLLLGFDDAVGCFLARNSWGASWGIDGHFLVRYRDVEDASFFTDLVSFARRDEVAAPPAEAQLRR